MSEPPSRQKRPVRGYLLSILVGEWRADMPPTRTYQIVEKEHAIQPSIWGGYERTNQLLRHSYSLDGEWLEDECVTDNRAKMMYEPLLEAGT